MGSAHLAKNIYKILDISDIRQVRPRMVRGLPKSYIKKYGISKRAWREYRKVHPKKGKTTAKKRSRSTKTGSRNVSRKGKMFGSISGIGALEDLGVGLVGGALFRALGQRENAIPATRIVQGLAGHAMGRRGKRLLISGVIDYVDNVLLSMLGMGVAGTRTRARIKLPFLQL